MCPRKRQLGFGRNSTSGKPPFFWNDLQLYEFIMSGAGLSRLSLRSIFEDLVISPIQFIVRKMGVSLRHLNIGVPC